MKICEINLKNQRATLHFLAINNTNNIFALNENKKEVGKCWFEIIDTYQLQCLSSPKNCENALQIAVPKEINLPRNINKIPEPTIIKGGNVFSLKNSHIKLNLIEVLDEKFYKVGLGWTFLKTMEQIANEKNCCEIRAWVLPINTFAEGAIDFYKRNNFFFETDKIGNTYATKTLKENKKIESMTK